MENNIQQQDNNSENLNQKAVSVLPKKKGIFKKKSTYIVLAIIVIVIIIVVVRGKGAQVEYVTEKVTSTDLIQTVSATGKVDSDNQVNLRFNATGEVEKLFVKVGDQVKEGDLLATLKNATLRNRIKEAQAQVSVQRANLQKVYEGAKDEEVRIANSRVNSAEVSLNNAKKDYDATKIKIDSDIAALKIEVANLTQAKDDAQVSSALTVSNSRSSLLVSLSQSHVQSENAINRVSEIINDTSIKAIFSAADGINRANVLASLDELTALNSNARTAFLNAQQSLSVVDVKNAYTTTAALLDEVEFLLDSTLQGLFATAETYDNSSNLSTWKTSERTDITTNNSSQVDVEMKYQAWNSAVISEPVTNNQAQYALDTVTSNLKTAEAQYTVQLAGKQAVIDNAQATLELAESERALTVSKATSSEVVIAQANLQQAQSGLDQITTQLSDYQLIAPFDAVVAKVSVEENENVLTATSSVLTLIGEIKYDITVDISESDIIKLTVGDKANITLDSYGEDVPFEGTVTHIDPAETVIQDVVYYKVDLEIVASDQVLKQGMTANVDIITEELKGITTIPSRAVLKDDTGRRYVRLLVNGDIVEATVTVGLRGDQGRIEILSGLEDGDEVVVFEKTIK